MSMLLFETQRLEFQPFGCCRIAGRHGKQRLYRLWECVRGVGLYVA